MVSKSIYFPDKSYVGFRLDGETLTGFLTPDGTDAAAAKRKETVDSWAKGYIWSKVEKVIPSKVFDNKPLSGFTIEKRLNRGGSWYGNQDKWKVDDPRGFQLEIAGTNLQNIIECTDISKGVIQGECIWGREGPNNVLIPVSTDLYKDAMKNTVRKGTSVKFSEVKPGEYVIFQNGKEGFYQGRYYIVEKQYKTNVVGNWALSSKPHHVFMSKDDKFFYIATTPKVSSIDRSEVRLCAEKEINSSKQIVGYSTHGRAVTSVKGSMKFELAPLTDDISKHDYVVYNDGDQLLCMRTYGFRFDINKTNYYCDYLNADGSYSFGQHQLSYRKMGHTYAGQQLFVCKWIIETGYGEEEFVL